MMVRIQVTDREGKRHDLDVQEGLTLMEPLRDLPDGVEALCGGMCSCSTCHVFVAGEWFDRLPARKDDELELLEGTEYFRPEQSRLACQVRLTAELTGITVTVAPAE
jgi:ferredoxin, 2Fe-2S